MLEKLAEALAAASDWPAAQDCLVQLSKAGMLSKHSKQLLRKISEQGVGPAEDNHAAYSAGSFKRRRILSNHPASSAAEPARLTLPSSDGSHLLDTLSKHLESHLAGNSASTYRFSMAQQASGTSDNVCLHDPQTVHDKINQQQLSQTTITTQDQDPDLRPQSAGTAALGDGGAADISADEPSSQECAERVSKRIAMRRSGHKKYCNMPSSHTKFIQCDAVQIF